MLKIFKTLILVLILIFSYPSISNAEEVFTNYNDFIENGKALDGKFVKIKGEAIGEPMRRGNYTWINISDGSNAMGIWLKNEDADKVKVFGNYKFKGDIVTVTGTFYRACSEHGGDMDIHAESLTVEKEGFKIQRLLNKSRAFAAIGLTFITLILFSIYYKRRV